ncbi:MAG: N-acetyl-alpha-D-muramate 1-phosphate uridylyltransferase [Verrucomicrobiota bacterium]|jgi:NDP-sugar pyrophosphorylase family protein
MTAPAEETDLAGWPVAILAGGLAKRLRPITETIPKSLVTIAGAPFLAHQLRLLHSAGLRRIVICAGYLGEMIEAEIGDGANFDLHVEYSFDGPRLLGTGGALKRALPLLGRRFFVLYGDSYLPIDYRKVALAFAASDKAGLMTVFRNQGRWDTSNIQFEAGRILRYDKKRRNPEMLHIDYGLGTLRAEALASWPDDEPFDLADVYRGLLSENQLLGYEVTERFYEIGSTEGLAELDAFLRRPPAIGPS